VAATIGLASRERFRICEGPGMGFGPMVRSVRMYLDRTVRSMVNIGMRGRSADLAAPDRA
jgi:hypothetical protein